MDEGVPDEVFRAYRSQLVYPSESDLRIWTEKSRSSYRRAHVGATSLDRVPTRPSSERSKPHRSKGSVCAAETPDFGARAQTLRIGQSLPVAAGTFSSRVRKEPCSNFSFRFFQSYDNPFRSSKYSLSI